MFATVEEDRIVRRILNALGKEEPGTKVSDEDRAFLTERGWKEADPPDGQWYDCQPEGDRVVMTPHRSHDGAKPLPQTFGGRGPAWHTFKDAMQIERERKRGPLPAYHVAVDGMPGFGLQKGQQVFNVLDKWKNKVLGGMPSKQEDPQAEVPLRFDTKAEAQAWCDAHAEKKPAVAPQQTKK